MQTSIELVQELPGPVTFIVQNKELAGASGEEAAIGVAQQVEKNAGMSSNGDSSPSGGQTENAVVYDFIIQASTSRAAKEIDTLGAEVWKSAKDYEPVHATLDDLDNVNAAKDASMSPLLSPNKGLSLRGGMLVKSCGTQADSNGNGMQSAAASRVGAAAPDLLAVREFQSQEPSLLDQCSQAARCDAPGYQEIGPITCRASLDKHDPSPLGLRMRRSKGGLALLKVPIRALWGGYGSFVTGVGSYTSSKEESAPPISQKQSADIWKQMKWPLKSPVCSPVGLLLILTACVVIVTASVVSLLFSLRVHKKLQILSDELQILRKDTRESVRSPISDYVVEGGNLEEHGARRFALYWILCSLITPFLFFKYVDQLPRLTGANIRGAEEKLPLSKQVAYKVDFLFSYHSFAKPLALLLATVFLIGAGGVALYAVGTESLTDTLWLAWTYIADAGNHANSVGFGPRFVSVCISFGGMLIFALMVGLVSDAISEKVDSLRKGKSQVVECNHTLILGWSDKLGSILRHLAIANKSLGGGVVVVLAERAKEAMEADIAELEFDFMGTFVICRSGSPLVMADLKKVSISTARSIIVLAEVENADQSDARALRVVLNLTGVKEGLRGHVVVELSDVDNEQLVKLVGGELVETMVAHDVIGRLMIQCARQPGLAMVWEDILGFENAEFYFRRWPQLDGMRFEDVLIIFPDAVPLGVKVAGRGGKIVLNPEDDYVLSEGDELLVLAEDDDTYAPEDLPEVRRGPLLRKLCTQKNAERILFCGWRRDIDDLILVLDAFLAKGSELWLFSEVPIKERDKKLQDGGLQYDQLVNTALVHREGNAVIRRHLESLPLESFDSILILADEALEDTPVKADSRSVATLLLIRDIQSKRMIDRGSQVRDEYGVETPRGSWIYKMKQACNNSIVLSEILDCRTKNLVSMSVISDYVMSNELVSMALAMVAEEKQINRVLEELFAKEGNEIYIRKAEIYLHDNEELSFYEIMIRARQRQEIVVGYRRASDEHATINPPDKATRTLAGREAGDSGDWTTSSSPCAGSAH